MPRESSRTRVTAVLPAKSSDKRSSRALSPCTLGEGCTDSKAVGGGCGETPILEKLRRDAFRAPAHDSTCEIGWEITPWNDPFSTRNQDLKPNSCPIYGLPVIA